MRIASAAALLLLAAPAWPRGGAGRMLKQLQETSGDAQIGVIRALGRGGQAKAAAPLLALFDVRKDSPRRSAALAEALGRLRAPEAGEPLLGAWDYLLGLRLQMDLTAQVQVLRGAVVEALGEIGGEGAAKVLGEALSDPDPVVVESAVRALGRMRDRKNLDSLIELSRQGGNIGQAACEALGRIGDAKAQPPLARALASENPIDGVPAAYGLALMGKKEGFARLEALVAGHEGGDNPALAWRVRLLAAAYLARLDKKAGLDFLVGVLESKAELELKIPAAEALGKSENPRAALPLVEASGAAEADLRLMIARGLGRLGGSRAVRGLRELAGDSNLAVRSAAAAALADLGDD